VISQQFGDIIVDREPPGHSSAVVVGEVILGFLDDRRPTAIDGGQDPFFRAARRTNAGTSLIGQQFNPNA
jgi:hypothetical protein